MPGDQFSTLMAAIQSIQDHQVQHDHRFADFAVQIKVVKADVRHIKVAIQSQGNADPANVVVPKVYRCIDMLPLKTYADLLSFEETLLKTDREDVAGYLCSIGGGTPKKMMANLVLTVYSLDLQMRVTWYGIKNHTGTWTKDPLKCRTTPQLFVGNDYC